MLILKCQLFPVCLRQENVPQVYTEQTGWVVIPFQTWLYLEKEQGNLQRSLREEILQGKLTKHKLKKLQKKH